MDARRLSNRHPTSKGVRPSLTKHQQFVDTLNMSDEEHKRRGDAADAMVQEMKRRIAGKG
jgi:hypothetical protein